MKIGILKGVKVEGEENNICLTESNEYCSAAGAVISSIQSINGTVVLLI